MLILHLHDLRQLEPGLGKFGVEGGQGRSLRRACGRSGGELGFSAVVDEVESALVAPANKSMACHRISQLKSLLDDQQKDP